MRKQLTSKDLIELGKLLEAKQLQEFYGRIKDAGFDYPSIGLSIITGELKLGELALEYMTNTALQHGLLVDDSKISEIKQYMAEGLLTTMETIAKSNNDTITREISWQEALDFHNKAFQKAGLPEECWILYKPLKEMLIY